MANRTVPTRGSAFHSPFFQAFPKDIAQWLDQLRGSSSADAPEDFFGRGHTLVPAIDVAETETGLEISADIPGVTEDQLDVTVQGDVLVIKGEKSTDVEEKDKDYHVVERRQGSFRRTVPLGFVPEKGAISADFTNGVLKLEIARPKNTESEVQKVRIGKP